MAPLGRRLPMNFVDAVPADVLAQLLKIASLAHLPLRVNAETAAMQKHRRQLAPFGQQIRIYPQLGLYRHASTHSPKATPGSPFEISPVDDILPALSRPTGPSQRTPF